mgnify:CR=1 FL=1
MDFRGALARGARRFEDIAPGGAGYFGWPAAARARTAERVMRLRGELIARALLASWGVRAPRRSAATARAAEPPRVAMASPSVVLPRAASRGGGTVARSAEGRGESVARGRGKECS